MVVNHNDSNSQNPYSTLVRQFLLSLVSTLLLPVWLVQSLVRSAQDGGRGYLLQRFGFYSTVKQPRQQNPQQPGSGEPPHLWVHCASVGEVKTALPLLLLLRQEIPSVRYTVTTMTPTGKDLLQQAAIPACEHLYLPVDHGVTVGRFLERVNPDYGLIIETELWPALYRSCHKRQIPISIVNARLSNKTLRITQGWKGRVLAPLLADALASTTQILARSEQDAAGFRQLLDFATQSFKTNNTDKQQLHVCGNLKNISNDTDLIATVPLSRSYCLLASTHDDEETRLTNAWFQNKRKELLVIVPRHPERGKPLQKQLSSYGQIVLRSETALNKDGATEQETQEIANDVSIYIADTVGELMRFYQHAAVTFVGGSLVGTGGHNVLEPARCNCAIVVGPTMHNFEAELKTLQSTDAIVQVQDEQQAVDTLVQLLDNPDKAAELGAAAAQSLNSGQSSDDVSAAYMTHLMKLLATND